MTTKSNDLDAMLAGLSQPKVERVPRGTSRPVFRRKLINVSPEVWEHLQKHSSALNDTPDSTLRRLLGLPQKEKRTRK